MTTAHRAIARYLSAAMVHVSAGMVLAALIERDGHFVALATGLTGGWYMAFSWLKKERL